MNRSDLRVHLITYLSLIILGSALGWLIWSIHHAL